MAANFQRFVGVRNLRRARLRVAGKNVQAGANSYIDLETGQARRELARYVSQGNALVSGAGAGVVKVALTGKTATTVGALFDIQLGEKVVVDQIVISVTTQSTGAANLGIGHNAAGAGGTANVTIVAAQSVAAAGDFALQAATAGGVVVGATEHIIGTGSADTTGLVGSVYIHYRALP